MDKIKKFNYKILKVKKLFPENSDYLNEKIVEQTMCTNLINDMNSLNDWYENLTSKKIKVETINLNEMDGWGYNDKNITHNSGKFFQVKGIRIHNSDSRMSMAMICSTAVRNAKLK